MKRASLTKRERASMALQQHGKCPCGARLGRDAIAEHWLPVALGNDAKPDTLLCGQCAKDKTRTDIRQIRKADRQAGRTGQQKRRREGKTRPIPSQGFRGHRRMNGEIVWRRP